MLPTEFHKYVKTDILNTYVVSTEREADAISKEQGSVDVIVFDRSKPVYPSVLKRLTNSGKEIVGQMQPWLVNVLVDWSSGFDFVICERSCKRHIFIRPSIDGTYYGTVPVPVSAKLLSYRNYTVP